MMFWPVISTTKERFETVGLFGGKDDTKQKIEELKAKMHMGHQNPQAPQPPQEPQPQWQGQQAPQQSSQQAPPPSWTPPQEAPQPASSPAPVHTHSSPPRAKPQDPPFEELESGIVLDLGDGMSLNLPIKSHMRLDEFLHLADRVRELQRLDAPREHARRI